MHFHQGFGVQPAVIEQFAPQTIDFIGVRDRAAMSALQVLRFALIGTDATLLWEVLPQDDGG